MSDLFLAHLLFSRTTNGDWNKEVWAGKAHCPWCEKKTDFSLVYNTASARFIGIPYFTATDDRFIQCDSCSQFKKLRIKEYRTIKKQQWTEIKKKNYPEEKILSDYDPHKNPIGGIITKFVLAILLVAYLTYVLVSAIFGGDFNGAYILLLAIGCVPLGFTLFRFIPAVKKRRLYMEASNHPGKFPSVDSLTPADRTYLFVDIWNKKREFEAGPGSFETYIDTHRSTFKADTTGADEISSEDNKPSGILGIWYTLCAIAGIVPFGFLSQKKLWLPCKYLCGKSHIKKGVVTFVCLLYQVIFLSLLPVMEYINKTNGGLLFVMILLMMASVGVGIPFTFVNRVRTRRIIKCLRLLEESESFKYMEEVIPYAKSDRTEAFLAEHILYDKPSMTVMSYQDIVWVYQRTDNEGKPYNYIGLKNGLCFSTTLKTPTLMAMADKYVIMSGNTRENKEAFRKIVRAYKESGK